MKILIAFLFIVILIVFLMIKNKMIRKTMKIVIYSVLGISVAGMIFLAYVKYSSPYYTDPVFKAKVKKIEELTKAGRQSVPELLKYLNDTDGQVRYEAIYNMKDFRDPRTFEPLINELKKTDHVVAKKWAAESLGMLGDKRAVDPLLETLFDSDYSIRYKSAFALGLLGDLKVLPYLNNVTKKDSFEYVQVYAHNAIIDILNANRCTNSGCHKDIYSAVEKKK